MACEVFVWIVTDVTSNLHAFESEFLRIGPLKCISVTPGIVMSLDRDLAASNLMQ